MSKRTAYQHFTSKDELVAEYLRRFDPDVMPGVFDRTDLTPRERLLAAFDIPASMPLCPYIAAAVELHDPQHPASQYARDYKTAIAARLAETAREAGATNPEQLGEQLALLLDGASARTRPTSARCGSPWWRGTKSSPRSTASSTRRSATRSCRSRRRARRVRRRVRCHPMRRVRHVVIGFLALAGIVAAYLIAAELLKPFAITAARKAADAVIATQAAAA